MASSFISSASASLELADYADDISLEVPFQAAVHSVSLNEGNPGNTAALSASNSSLSYSSVLQSLTKYFLAEYHKNHKTHKHSHGNENAEEDEKHDSEEESSQEADDEEDESTHSVPSSERRRMLRSLLCVRSPTTIPEPIQMQLDSLLQFELRQDERIAASSIPTIAQQFAEAGAVKDVSAHLSLWRGDITTLSADCIVNAANSALLGCFQPSHMCIDNIIHAAAGPRLRLDCATIMRKQRIEESVGKCKVTRGYHLPARYVLHTVGPQIEDGRTEETEIERKQLAACYISCLNAAAQLKNVRSVAFCCISTGLFGFPAVSAAKIAIQTVSDWLRQQNEKQVSKIDRVIFNVFKESDEKIYSEIFSKLTGIQHSNKTIPARPIAASFASAYTSRISSNLSKAADWLASADAVLIAGAAGLSASCGLDYTSESVFKRLFPAMYQRGFRCMYEFIGFKDWTPALQWGYLLSQINLARFNWRSENDCEIYQILLKVFQHFGEASFVLTSNVDGLFEQNGFDVSRVYTAQGDYALIQCLKPCAQDSLWPTKPFIDAALPFIDKRTQEISNAAVIPKCKRCGGPVMLNVRGGNWFLEEHLMGKRATYLQWLNGMLKTKKRIVLLEIGVGFNTAPVIRFPMESLAEKHSNVRLIRINQHQPQVPKHLLGERALAIDIDATEAVRVIAQPILQRMEKHASVAATGAQPKMDIEQI